MNSKKENPIYNLGFNILIPVLILNKSQDFFSSDQSALYSLIIALSFPFLYGLKDFVREKKINSFSIIGLFSTALTGGFALLQLEGFYFAIKEAAIPLILAFIIMGSIFMKKPLISFFLFHSSLFDKQIIEERLKVNRTEKDFKKLMNRSTWVLSTSFILSAILNFIVAIYVFKDIPLDIEENLKKQIINKQVADMTWMGYVFIALPLTLITVFLLWWILKRIQSLTDLSLEDIMPQFKKIKDKDSN